MGMVVFLFGFVSKPIHDAATVKFLYCKNIVVALFFYNISLLPWALLSPVKILYRTI
jgi:hypothetical protein